MSVASYNLSPLPAVGEPISVLSSVNSVASTSITTGTNTVVQSLTLTEGTWVVSGTVTVAGASGATISAGAKNYCFLSTGAGAGVENASYCNAVPALNVGSGACTLLNGQQYISNLTYLVYVPAGTTDVVNLGVCIDFGGGGSISYIGGTQSNTNFPCSISATRVI